MLSAETTEVILHLDFQARGLNRREATWAIRKELHPQVPVQVLPITAAREPAHEHTGAVKGGLEDLLITFQMEPSGNCFACPMKWI